MSRILDSIARCVAYFASRTDYHAIYTATVVRQLVNGLLELRLDDPIVPHLCNVPIRYGVPGISARVRVGARVGVQFGAGDPSRPIVTVWERADVESITVLADVVYIGSSENAKMVARKGDCVWLPLPIEVMATGIVGTNTPFAGKLVPLEPMLGVIDSGSDQAFA